MSTTAETGRSPRSRTFLARVLLGVAVLGLAAGILISFLDEGVPLGDLAFAGSFVAFPIIGYILAIRRPENSVGWVMLGIGATLGLGAVMSEYGSYAMDGGPGGPDLAAVLLAIDEASWVPIVALPGTFLILLFPDGHLPSTRWRWFARLLGAGLTVVYLMILVAPGPLSESAFPDLQNPLGIQALEPVLPFVFPLIALLPIGVLGSLLALVLRYRRSVGVERLQLRWLMFASAVPAGLYALALVLSFSSDWTAENTPTWIFVLQSAAIPTFALIPIAIGVAILKHRMLDIDLVINRALLYAGLAVFVTIVYVAIVVGVGALVGSRSNAVLSALAAAVVALAFQPVRQGARRIVNRLVYGKRASPYEVLSEFSDRLGNAYASDELLPRMALVLAEGTGAERADVWVRLGNEFRCEASWPTDAEPEDPIPTSEDGSVSGVHMLEPVRHRDELLGALSIRKKAGDPIRPTEESLVRDLAGQAGLVMRNVALTEQLRQRIEELRASRQRLVSAQDEERRKLERNIHDGAQQQLVALSVRMKLAESLVDRDPEKAKESLRELQGQTTDALEDLRDLARGIYPPLLADEGLAAALEAQARKSPVPVKVHIDGVGRYPAEVEAAVYFCSLEALNNVAKYAGASAAEIRLGRVDSRLTFSIADDGRGFDQEKAGRGTGLQGMTDRLDAVGGELEVTSSPGSGTVVRGSVPTG